MKNIDKKTQKQYLFLVTFVAILGLAGFICYKNYDKLRYETRPVCPDEWVSHMRNYFVINGKEFVPSEKYVQWTRQNCKTKPRILD